MLRIPRRRRNPPSPVDCDAVQEAISARLDNETTPLDEPTITRHLSECPPCRAFRQAWQTPASQLVGLTRELRLGPVISPPSGLTERAARETQHHARPPRPSSSPRHVQPALAAAGRYLLAGAPAAVALICLHAGLAHPPPQAARSPSLTHCTLHPSDLWVSPEITASR